MARFWRKTEGDADDLDDVVAPPRVVFGIAETQVAAALVDLADRSAQADGEVLGAEMSDAGPVVTFGHRYDRRTAVLRRLSSLQRAHVEVRDFAWLDAVTEPDEQWLADAFARWETGRHRDPSRVEPIEVARRRFGRLQGTDVVLRLLEDVGDPALEQRRRRTVAHAAVLAAFNTHTTEAGDALVGAGVEGADIDGHTAMNLLDGARGIAELGRYGIGTTIAEAPLIPLLDHEDWRVHGAATQLLAALGPPRSTASIDVLVRLARQLASGSKATEIRADQVVAALATAPDRAPDVDDALDGLRHHVASAVRVAATSAIAQRQPGRARDLWQPWLTSRSTNERLAAEQMIATLGDERDVAEVVRIVEHRTKPPKGTTYWPPLAADGIEFLIRHEQVPEAAAALERVRGRWARHDDDLRRWLLLHHPALVPPPGDR